MRGLLRGTPYAGSSGVGTCWDVHGSRTHGLVLNKGGARVFGLNKLNEEINYETRSSEPTTTPNNILAIIML